MSNTRGLWRSLSWLLMSGLMVLMLNACPAYAKRPTSDKGPANSHVDVVKELVDLRADKAFLMDYADNLTVKLEATKELLILCEDQEAVVCPDDGPPWTAIIVSALAGGLVVALLD